MDPSAMPETTRLTGSCLCGACSFEADTQIAMINNCHCTGCRKVTGAVYGTLLWLLRDDVRRMGDFEAFNHTADSGSAMTKTFCRTCGSQMFSENSSRPHLIAVRAGILDQKELVRPTFNVFCDSAIPSTPLDPDLERHDRMRL